MIAEISASDKRIDFRIAPEIGFKKLAAEKSSLNGRPVNHRKVQKLNSCPGHLFGKYHRNQKKRCLTNGRISQHFFYAFGLKCGQISKNSAQKGKAEQGKTDVDLCKLGEIEAGKSRCGFGC